HPGAEAGVFERRQKIRHDIFLGASLSNDMLPSTRTSASIVVATFSATKTRNHEDSPWVRSSCLLRDLRVFVIFVVAFLVGASRGLGSRRFRRRRIQVRDVLQMTSETRLIDVRARVENRLRVLRFRRLRRLHGGVTQRLGAD